MRWKSTNLIVYKCKRVTQYNGLHKGGHFVIIPLSESEISIANNLQQKMNLSNKSFQYVVNDLGWRFRPRDNLTSFSGKKNNALKYSMVTFSWTKK